METRPATDKEKRIYAECNFPKRVPEDFDKWYVVFSDNLPRGPPFVRLGTCSQNKLLEKIRSIDQCDEGELEVELTRQEGLLLRELVEQHNYEKLCDLKDAAFPGRDTHKMPQIRLKHTFVAYESLEDYRMVVLDADRSPTIKKTRERLKRLYPREEFPHLYEGENATFD